jgi:hypothetical protein
VKKSRWQTGRNHKDVWIEGKESPRAYYENYVGKKWV